MLNSSDNHDTKSLACVLKALMYFFFYLHVYNCSVTGTSKRKELPVTLLVEPSVLLHVTNYLSYNENTFDYANY